MDNNSHGSWMWSDIWYPEEGRHRPDGSRYISMLWLNGIARQNPYPLATGGAVQQWPEWSRTDWVPWNPNTGNRNNFELWLRNGNIFYSYTQTGLHATTANRMTDKFLPNTEYVFTVERTPEYYKQSMTGEFFFGGFRTYSHTKFHLPDNDPTSPRYNRGVPTWRFNQSPEELMGWIPPNNTIHFDAAPDLTGWERAESTFVYDTWPKDSAFPDYFQFGLPHVNHYVSSAAFTRVELWTGTPVDEATFTLNATAGAGGIVQGTPSTQPFNGLPYQYSAGAFIAVTAVPDPGYEFAGWLTNGVTLADNQAAVAHFAMPNRPVTLIAAFVAQGEQFVPVTNLRVTGAPLQLQRGRTAQLTANAAPANATIQDVVWTTSNPNLAAVDVTGLVTAGTATGTVTITATTLCGAIRQTVILRIM